MSSSQIPCGNCPAGVYADEAIKAGVNMFGGMDVKQALQSAPRCKHNPNKICMGCRDFIVYCLPTTESPTHAQ